MFLHYFCHLSINTVYFWGKNLNYLVEINQFLCFQVLENVMQWFDLIYSSILSTKISMSRRLCLLPHAWKRIEIRNPLNPSIIYLIMSQYLSSMDRKFELILNVLIIITRQINIAFLMLFQKHQQQSKMCVCVCLKLNM